jgi:hypothetical protein
VVRKVGSLAVGCVSGKPRAVGEDTHHHTQSHERSPPELERPEQLWPERGATEDDVGKGGGDGALFVGAWSDRSGKSRFAD